MRINWLGVIISAIIMFIVRYLWAAHFGGADWAHFATKAVADVQANHKAAGMALGAAVVTSAVLGWAIGLLRDRSLVSGVGVGIMTAVGFAATTMSAEYIFYGAPLKTFLIDSGQYLAAYVIGGAIIGAMAPKTRIRAAYSLSAEPAAAEHHDH